MLQMETLTFEAESTAYWVLQMLNVDGRLDTSEYSFGYIAGWSKDKEMSELKENLEVIKNTANELVSKIDAELLRRAQEQSVDVAAVPEEAVVAAPRRKSR